MSIFIDREEELKKFSILGKVNVIFGRRRVGKTRFVKELLKEKIKNKEAIYLLAINRDLKTNLKRFSQNISSFYGIPGLNFTSYREMFEFLNTRKETEVVVIDEFGYLIKHGILPEFQEIVDEILKKKLILTGSSISLMESSFLDYRSPIYGRVDKILHLQPLRFRHIFQWFRSISFEDALKIYAVTDGVPRYLEFFQGKNVENEIIKQFFDQTFLFYDARKLLEEELKETERYFSILEAISKGKNTLNEIRNFTGIEYQSIPFYLQKLSRLKIISRLKSVIGKSKSIYQINDNYYSFWFAFVYPYEEEIDSGFADNAINNFKRLFNTYLGRVYEKVCLEILIDTRFFNFTKIGKWWHKDKEIDILALNDQTREILFCECKWQNKVNPEKICKDLVENKIPYVNWNNEKRKESIAIFAKSFKKKINEFEGRKVYCFDLKELEKFLNPVN